MSAGRVTIWSGRDWVEAPAASMEKETLVVSNIAAIVRRDGPGAAILLQRRDKPEVVRGLLEIPTGRRRAGETPAQAVRREVGEEVGLQGRSIAREGRRHEAHPKWPVWAAEPVAVVVGAEGAYPTLLVTFTRVAEGEPRALPGETADPRGYSRKEVLALLRDDPRRFAAVAYVAAFRTSFSVLGRCVTSGHRSVGEVVEQASGGRGVVGGDGLFADGESVGGDGVALVADDEAT
ncbi:MAG: NUDIX hydrolase, partial [Actinomycetota bacterium]